MDFPDRRRSAEAIELLLMDLADEIRPEQGLGEVRDGDLLLLRPGLLLFHRPPLLLDRTSVVRN
jgi:hypothetical protein